MNDANSIFFSWYKWPSIRVYGGWGNSLLVTVFEIEALLDLFSSLGRPIFQNVNVGRQVRQIRQFTRTTSLTLLVDQVLEGD